MTVKGEIYVVDSQANKVLMFKRDGSFAGSFGEFGSKPG